MNLWLLLIKLDKFILKNQTCLLNLLLNLIRYGMFFGERTTVPKNWENKSNLELCSIK